MDRFGFPKRIQSQKTGRSGETYFDYFITSKLGWIYRPVHRESDFGIDGFIDIITNEEATGRSIAVQIKCGDSYLADRTSHGFKYNGDSKHINFYLNNNVPILLVIMSSDCSLGFWTLFDINRTMQTKNGWWQEIARSSILDEKVKPIWESIAGYVADYSDKVNSMWHIDSLLEEVGMRVFSIPKEEIENESMEYIINIINRLSKTKDHALKNRGLMEIYFPEYDNDSREVFEIPEIRKWIKKTMDSRIPWFYFLDTSIKGAGLSIIAFCVCDYTITTKMDKRYLLSLNTDELNAFLKDGFNSMNIFCQDHDIDESIIEERSKAIIKVYDNNK